MFENPEDAFEDDHKKFVMTIRENLKGHFLFDLIDKFCEASDQIRNDDTQPDEWFHLIYNVACSQLFDERQIHKLQGGWLYLGELRGRLRIVCLGVQEKDPDEMYFSENPEELNPAFDSFLNHIRLLIRDVGSSQQPELLN